MIRLGLRLTLGGGKEAAVRFVVTAAAVALGAGLLLITLAGINAVNAQNDRYAWLGSGSDQASPAAAGSAPAGASGPARSPIWWMLRGDYYAGQIIGRIDVAATGPRSPVPPGIPHLPRPGQFYASPVLRQLLRATPAGQLADRYPGKLVGTIGSAALPAPNSLLIIIGHTADELSRVPGAKQVSSIQTTPVPIACGGCLFGLNANGIDLTLSVVAGALLFPVLIFIVTATRLSAARREQRFAAIRLAGGTPRQVSAISAVESTVAAVTGVAAGIGLFFLLRPAVAAIPFTGAPFFPGDLSLSLADTLAVAIGVPAAAAVAARLALRRVQISPLGVSRRVTPRPPRAWRVIPPLAGVAELACVLAIGSPNNTPGQIAAFLPGFLLIMAGLIIAGPWLTMVGARVMARRARRPALLLAARRLADNPQAGFRAISGLVLALFVTSVAVGVITTISANRGTPSGGAAARDTLVGFQDYSPVPNPVDRVPGAVLGELRSIHGVQGVTLIHTNPLGAVISAQQIGMPSSFGGTIMAGLVSCAELTRTPTLGSCPAGAQAAAILPPGIGSRVSRATIVWHAAAISAQRLQQLPVQSIVVSTGGSTAAIERARTVLDVAYPDQVPPATMSESAAMNDLTGWQQLADVVVIVTLVIAGCTLAASVAAGLSERKRPFSLLRLTGAPLGVLRRVVATETAVPLLAVAVVSTGAGFLAAQLFLSAQMDYSLRPPGAGYYVIVLTGLAASLAIVAATMPLLTRITGPETARNE